MRVLKSKAVALLGTMILVLAACGSSAPNPVDPVGGVAAAFDAAKSGGVLKQMDLATCLTTGGSIGGAFSGLFGGVTGDAFAKAGITQDDLSAAWKISFDDLKTTETSRSGDKAIVHVNVKMTSQVDPGKMRDLVKKYAATQGIVPDDATIDAAIQAKLGGQMTMSLTIDKDLSVVQQNDKLVACGAEFGTAGAAGAAGAAPLPTLSGTTPSIWIPAASTTGASGWQTYADPSGGYSVEFPGQATESSLGGPKGAAWTSTDGKTGYFVVYGDGSGASDPSATLDALLAELVRQFQWTLDQSSKLTIDGFPALTFAAHSQSQAEQTKGLTVTMRGSIILNGSRGYEVVAGAVEPNDADETRFFGSFKITAPRATAAPAIVTPSPSPIPLPLIATAVATGSGYACAIRSGGGLVCWGNNRNGQLGDGTTTVRLQPTMVAGVGDSVAVATSRSQDYGFSCTVRSGGSVLCWGYNGNGQLGNGALTSSLTPVPVSGVTDTIAVAAGGAHACALRSDGGVLCWGNNGSGQLGDRTISSGAGGNKPTPAAVAGIDDATAIVAGDSHTCVLRSSGQVACWGYDLASGTQHTGGTPTNVAGVSDAVGISAGGSHTCALLRTGGILCWGNNESRQLGDGSTVAYSKTPVTVSGIADATAIAAGQYYTCALRSDHRIACWGDNYSGQLGDGTTTISPNPVNVFAFTDATAVAAGANTTCAVTSDGHVMCWGAGPLGDGSSNSSLVPVLVVAQ